MPSSTADPETTKDTALRAALWHSIGRTVDAISTSDTTTDNDLNATPRFIGALAELVHAQIATAARDVESFAKHAGRDVVRAEDVVLLGRRTEGLEEVLRGEVKRVREEEGS